MTHSSKSIRTPMVPYNPLQSTTSLSQLILHIDLLHPGILHLTSFPSSKEISRCFSEKSSPVSPSRPWRLHQVSPSTPYCTHTYARFSLVACAPTAEPEVATLEVKRTTIGDHARSCLSGVQTHCGNISTLIEFLNHIELTTSPQRQPHP